ncbi:hypothetical protein NQZ79_g3295 [Umbelopsis isabellina]|nr:hypothetical protein NQZ79_g3295 [Umbelopsis isabellina]
MTPEELILQLKKKGTFDELRKQALQEFQADASGQSFASRISQILLNLEAEDPALFAKDKSSVHNAVLERLETSSVYEDAKRDMLEKYLQSDAISTRIDEEIRALAPADDDTSMDVDTDRRRERSSSKESGEAEDD